VSCFSRCTGCVGIGTGEKNARPFAQSASYVIEAKHSLISSNWNSTLSNMRVSTVVIGTSGMKSKPSLLEVLQGIPSRLLD
jgi:hypothetical protein